jgi:hypothetical protein
VSESSAEVSSAGSYEILGVETTTKRIGRMSSRRAEGMMARMERIFHDPAGVS